ncbi:MAG: class II fructose-bisphosphatase [Rhodospirillales bacterium]|jgi:fructose-1,6-bisphosphatase II / sedoheptulose-1,7-bisphosphatase|nr:class II fructose-bisphosphatase [Rhodospirillales bacterium]
MDRYLALEAVRVTESAALAAHRHMGQGDEEAADRAAVNAMQSALDMLDFDGRICIGEGREGDTEDLYVGQKVGSGSGITYDVALMPLEGTSIIARGGYNAVSAMALTASGGLLEVPALYMEKIAIGPDLPNDIIDIDAPPADNLSALAGAKGLKVDDLVVCMLDRPRHNNLISAVRESGARIKLILDGDVSGVIASALPDAGVDIFMGSGLAAQGVLAAAALRALGGQMQARLIVRNDTDRKILAASKLENPDERLTVSDMVKSDVTFAATGITTGPILEGINRSVEGAVTHSMVLRSHSQTRRFIQSCHKADTILSE